MAPTRPGWSGSYLWKGKYDYQFITDTLKYTTRRYQGVMGIEHSVGHKEDWRLTKMYVFSISPMKFIKLIAEDPGLANVSLFSDNKFQLTDRLSFSFGLRKDSPKQLHGRLSTSPKGDYSEDEIINWFGEEPFPTNLRLKISDNISRSYKISYTIDPKNNIYAGYNTFFILPSIEQLFDEDYGNMGLIPSKGKNYSIGYNKVFSENNTMMFNLWKRKTSVSIGLEDDGEWTNYSGEKASGWNLQWNNMINKRLSLMLGWSHFMDFYSKDTQGGWGDTFNNGYRPKDLITLLGSYDYNKFNFTLDGRYFIRQKYVNPLGDFKAWPHDRYFVANLSINYRPNKKAKFFLQINNLLNTWWADRTHAIYPGQASSIEQKKTQIYTMPGRNYMFGVEYTF